MAALFPKDPENIRPVEYRNAPDIGLGFHGLVPKVSSLPGNYGSSRPAVAVPLNGENMPHGAIKTALRLGSELRLYANPEPLSQDFIRKLEDMREKTGLKFRPFYVGELPSIPGYKFKTMQHPKVSTSKYGGLSVARQLAIAQARAAGENSLLMLDDDIELSTYLHHFITVPCGLRAIGFRMDGFQDTDVIKRKKAKLRAIQSNLSGDLFPFDHTDMALVHRPPDESDFVLGGGAMLVDPQTYQGFSPPGIYNEDIFQMFDSIREGTLYYVDGATQSADRNQTPKRARGQEFGEVILDGFLYAIRHGKPQPYCDESMWMNIIAYRKKHHQLFLEEAETTLALVIEHGERTHEIIDGEVAACWDAIDVAKAAIAELDTITVEHCASYAEYLYEDQKQLNEFLLKQKESTIEAFAEELNITHPSYGGRTKERPRTAARRANKHRKGIYGPPTKVTPHALRNKRRER